MKVFVGLALLGIVVNIAVVMASGQVLSGVERQMRQPKFFKADAPGSLPERGQLR